MKKNSKHLKLISYSVLIKKSRELMFNNIDHVKKLNPICENMDIQKEVKKELRRVF